ncbi:cation:proton antiporter [Microbacterium sp.]|uniref:cation:proton antiporter n=1 Tax=Microbacterium sp. TaxID=51671 RepID=UPI003A92C1FD
MNASDMGLILIPVLAVAAPLLARGLRRAVRVPIIVFELALGILIGPAVLGWVAPGIVVDRLSDFGVAMLFFMAGAEIDFRAVAGRPLVRASIGWVLSLVLGVGVGLLIAPSESMVVIGIALSSTALGTLMPILRDAGELGTPFGNVVTAIGTVGEFLPLIAISIFLSTRRAPVAAVVLLAFVLLAGIVIFIARRSSHGQLHEFIRATLHTSEQFGVRFVLMLLAGLVGLSVLFDLDMLLGAFVAGAVWRIIMTRAPKTDAEAIESKLEAVAFGLLVPIFFIYTGVTFDLGSLLASPVALALVPGLLVALLVIRGTAAQFSAPRGTSLRERGAIGMLAATGLPIIVAVTSIGVSEELLSPAIAAALVGAGMLSVLLYPLIGMILRGDRAKLATAGAEPPGEL